MRLYRGWEIYQDFSAPITGRWKAIQFGVRMGASTEEAVKRMVDNKIAEREAAGWYGSERKQWMGS